MRIRRAAHRVTSLLRLARLKGHPHGSAQPLSLFHQQQFPRRQDRSLGIRQQVASLFRLSRHPAHLPGARLRVASLQRSARRRAHRPGPGDQAILLFKLPRLPALTLGAGRKGALPFRLAPHPDHLDGERAPVASLSKWARRRPDHPGAGLRAVSFSGSDRPRGHRHGREGQVALLLRSALYREPHLGAQPQTVSRPRLPRRRERPRGQGRQARSRYKFPVRLAPAPGSELHLHSQPR